MTRTKTVPDERGRFGPFGGQYVPETLMNALEELEQGFKSASADATFHKELHALMVQYSGRPDSALLLPPADGKVRRGAHLLKAGRFKSHRRTQSE